jgi:hypothetical protein
MTCLNNKRTTIQHQVILKCTLNTEIEVMSHAGGTYIDLLLYWK